MQTVYRKVKVQALGTNNGSLLREAHFEERGLLSPRTSTGGCWHHLVIRSNDIPFRKNLDALHACVYENQNNNNNDKKLYFGVCRSTRKMSNESFDFYLDVGEYSRSKLWVRFGQNLMVSSNLSEIPVWSGRLREVRGAQPKLPAHTLPLPTPKYCTNTPDMTQNFTSDPNLR